MYQLTRQLDLLASINWSVVQASEEDRNALSVQVVTCKTLLEDGSVFSDIEKLAQALMDFTTLVELVSKIGELRQENRWLLTIAEKLLDGFGPEEDLVTPNPVSEPHSKTLLYWENPFEEFSFGRKP